MEALTQFLQTIPGAIILLVIGFVGLIKGADFFVEGASNVAKRLRVPSLIIGLTIVAMGTSLPETAVSISASLAGSNSLAISNVSGSNLFNLLVVVGLCAIFQTVDVDKDTIRRDIPYSILAAVLLVVLGMVGVGDGMVLGRIDGIILLAFFAGFLFLMIRSALRARNNEGIQPGSDEEELVTQSVLMSIISIVGGAAAIAIGGDWVVDSASTLAMKFGMSETLVGLTIVAVGTSLPELVTSIVAARKGEVDMALGNAIGSNVFNILLVLGIASSISPIGFIMNNAIDILAVVVATLICWVVAGKTKQLKRPMGILMVLAYVAYMVYVVMRDMPTV
ncbi:MAG: calcium/sodium antiporter [Lachnospiraceae bacterium]|nr:calcium/sodium antiporter [Lachnospiraceae bacterium]